MCDVKHSSQPRLVRVFSTDTLDIIIIVVIIIVISIGIMLVAEASLSVGKNTTCTYRVYWRQQLIRPVGGSAAERPPTLLCQNRFNVFEKIAQ